MNKKTPEELATILAKDIKKYLTVYAKLTNAYPPFEILRSLAFGMIFEVLEWYNDLNLSSSKNTQKYKTKTAIVWEIVKDQKESFSANSIYEILIGTTNLEPTQISKAYVSHLLSKLVNENKIKKIKAGLRRSCKTIYKNYDLQK